MKPTRTRCAARVPGLPDRRKHLTYVFDAGDGGSIILYYRRPRDAFIAAAERQERAETFPLWMNDRAISVVIA